MLLHFISCFGFYFILLKTIPFYFISFNVTLCHFISCTPIAFQLDAKCQGPVTTSTPFQWRQDRPEEETPGSAFSSQLHASYNDEAWEMTENVTYKDGSNSLGRLNTFLESRDINPIRYTMQKSWNETSQRTKPQHLSKARQAVSAVLSEVAPKELSQLWNALSKSQVTEGYFQPILTVVLGQQMKHYWKYLQLATRIQTNGILADK